MKFANILSRPRRAILFLVPVALIGAAAPTEPEQTPSTLADALGAALQGDAVRARRILLATSPNELSATDLQWRNCLIDRFAANTPVHLSSPIGGTAGQALSMFRTYWQQALLGSGESAAADERLKRQLQQFLKSDETESLDDTSMALEKRLRSEGWWSLLGQTGRLREFMLWRKQEERTFEVKLPSGTYHTKVVLLSDFASLGWGDYATCGRRGAGGWATQERLFAVVPRYQSLEGEEFRVTFLAHETQHFADLRRWSGLAPWQLEYRAKLVELSRVMETKTKVLTKFLEDRGTDVRSPHSYANALVIRDLMTLLDLTDPTTLETIPTEALHEAALSLLANDNGKLSGVSNPSVL